MKLCSNVCNRCRLVCVKFYLNGPDLRLLLQNVKGLTFLGHMVLIFAVLLSKLRNVSLCNYKEY